MSVNRLVVNAEGPEIRVGVIQNGILSEYYLEAKHGRTMVGNIYRGRVTRVLPGMQAAFVDLGPSVERAAFLYVGDILGSGDSRALFADTDSDDEDAPARMSRKQASARKIEELVKPGGQILVQIVKDPIGLKGARVTGFLSLPGRYSVFMPAVKHVGVSRRIASDKERKRLRKLVNRVRTKGGIIVRTAAEGAPDQEIQDDVDYLIRLWGEIGRREKSLKGPGLVYADLDLVLRTVRDLQDEYTEEIVIDDRDQYERARKFTSAFLPSTVDRIVHYDEREPIFDHYGIEAELRAALRRRVPLASGGSLVIDQGEALTAIDINTGSFVGQSDLEETVTRNNLEACEEVARQLRLRNIGGIIVIDFVDMEKESNRKKVWEAFHKALSADRSRCNVTRISELGLIEMTRKRTRESLNQLLMEPCHECEGSGRVKSASTVANEILRAVRRVGASVNNQSVEVECAPHVADVLRRLDRTYVDELEKKLQKRIVVKASRGLKITQFKIAGKLEVEPDPERDLKRIRGRSGRKGKNNAVKAGKTNRKAKQARGKGRTSAAAASKAKPANDKSKPKSSKLDDDKAKPDAGTSEPDAGKAADTASKPAKGKPATAETAPDKPAAESKPASAATENVAAPNKPEADGSPAADRGAKTDARAKKRRAGSGAPTSEEADPDQAGKTKRASASAKAKTTRSRSRSRAKTAKTAEPAKTAAEAKPSPADDAGAAPPEAKRVRTRTRRSKTASKPAGSGAERPKPDDEPAPKPRARRTRTKRKAATDEANPS